VAEEAVPGVERVLVVFPALLLAEIGRAGVPWTAGSATARLEVAALAGDAVTWPPSVWPTNGTRPLALTPAMKTGEILLLLGA